MSSQVANIGKGKRVALGMSGGVDSSVCAHLLKEQGYEVTGVYLECWRAPGCRTEEDRKDALKVALELDIPFQVLDFKDAYKQRVVENFFEVYEAGQTPNPDVLCNKEIKFGLFYDWALRQAQGKQAFDYIATGHYARIDASGQIPDSSRNATGNVLSSGIYDLESSLQTGNSLDIENTYSLVSAVDSRKDQTYFLYRLRNDQLPHILFPIGHLTKQQVREEAKKRNIPVANKPDSQGICFIGEINVHNFLRERLGENPGEVVNTKGEVMGSHQGLWFYTIGQRHGFEIFGSWKSKQGEVKHSLPPYYVISKNPEKNQLVVGFGEETLRSEFELTEVHFIDDRFEIADASSTDSNSAIKLPSGISHLGSLYVRIRHGGKLIPVESCKMKGERVSVKLAESVQGVAEGQSAVFYLRNTDKHGFNTDFTDGQGSRTENGERRTENGGSRIENRVLRQAQDEKGKTGVAPITKHKTQTTVTNEPTTNQPVNYICLGGGVISS